MTKPQNLYFLCNEDVRRNLSDFDAGQNLPRTGIQALMPGGEVWHFPFNTEITEKRRVRIRSQILASRGRQRTADALGLSPPRDDNNGEARLFLFDTEVAERQSTQGRAVSPQRR